MVVEVYCDECGKIVQKDIACWACYQKAIDRVSKLEETVEELEAKL